MRRSENTGPRAAASITVVAVVVALLGAVSPSVASAQSFAVGLTSPKDGDDLSIYATFYDGPSDRYVVTGRVSYPTGTGADYEVKLNGQFLDPTWTVSTPSASGDPALDAFTFVSKVAFPTDDDRLFRTVTLTMKHRASGRYKLSQLTLIDLRKDGRIRPRRNRTDVVDGLGVQITTSGLDALEPTHLASLPDPDLADFNGRLHSRATGYPRRALALDTRFARNDKACIPLSQAQSLLGTEAWTAIYDEALTHYALYEAAGQGRRVFNAAVAALPGGAFATAVVGLGVAAYKAAECVREPPNPLGGNQFEVCVNTIDGQIVDMDVAGVRDVDLTFDKGGAVVAAKVTTDAATTAVDVSLSNVFLRWAVPHGLCSLRPDQLLTRSDLAGHEFAEFASCRNVQVVDDFLATVKPNNLQTRPAKFNLAVDTGNPERLGTESRVAATFVSDPSSTITIPVTTSCAASGLSTPTRDLVNLMADDIAAAASVTWNEAVPYPVGHQVQALDDLLSPLEVGTRSPGDIDLALNYTDLVAPVGVVDGANGLVGLMQTDVTRQGTTSPLGLFHTPGDDTAESRQSTTGNDPSGQPFDVSYTVSTAFLNQVLRERSQMSQWLAGNLELTWGDFGLTPPGSSDPTVPIVLDADTLPLIHPAFSSLGLTRSDRVRLWVNPMTQPVVNIPREPVYPNGTLVLPGDSWVTYQMGRVMVTLEKAVPGAAPEKIVSFALGFYDPDFSLSIDPAGGPALLAAFGPDRSFTAAPVVWRMRGCQLKASLAGAPASCSEQVSNRLLGAILPVLEGRLAGMLSDVPAPQRFDAAGRSTVPAVQVPRRPYVWDQMITFFANVIPEPGQP
ncbi:MAG: hypothetical protein R2708_06690 [Vicinamibacterales bacterium]